MVKENKIDAGKLSAKLENTFDNLINTVSLFSDEQINKPYGEGIWTAGQLAQHVVLSTQTMPKEKTADTDRPFDKLAGEIDALFSDHSVKFQAMPFLVPEKKDYTVNEILENIRGNQKMVQRYIDTKDLSKLVLDMELPGWGHLTRYEWLILMDSHTRRHTHQLKQAASSFGITVAQ